MRVTTRQNRPLFQDWFSVCVMISGFPVRTEAIKTGFCRQEGLPVLWKAKKEYIYMLRLSKLFSKTSTQRRVGNLTVVFYSGSIDRYKKIEWMFCKRERLFIFVHARLTLNHVTLHAFTRHVYIFTLIPWDVWLSQRSLRVLLPLFWNKKLWGKQIVYFHSTWHGPRRKRRVQK
jgi:hypothetical protein